MCYLNYVMISEYSAGESELEVDDMTFPIKKWINIELFVHGMTALYFQETWIRNDQQKGTTSWLEGQVR